MPYCSRARIAGCSTHARRFRACARRRNTPCGSEAATTTAWDCSMESSSRKITSWLPGRSVTPWRRVGAAADEFRWKSKSKICLNCNRRSRPARTSPCSTNSRCRPCARPLPTTRRRPDPSNWKPPAGSPLRPSATSPQPASTTSPSAASPSTYAPSICPCASSGSPQSSGGAGSLEDPLRLGDPVALGVIDPEALQHVDDLLIFGELGDGLLARQMPDFVDGAHHLAVDGVVQDFLDETAVDLQVVDREVLQIAER